MPGQLALRGCLYLLVIVLLHRGLPFCSWSTASAVHRRTLRCRGSEAESEKNWPRMYYQENRGTPLGKAFWGRSTTEKWGEFAEGDPGKFDKDDLVEAKYPGTDDWYCAQVMKYIGEGDWIIQWMDDMPDDAAKASVVPTKEMKHVKLNFGR
ncbi:unnamed protein product [Symbiodinium natans]|uniref:Uncharacterized protein n=1 Tax=Symbiodinium natans TaxID=878477 RepID=A0A812PVK7_9DINO|nr:unnamed protein product [Symbiodinium natans]